MKKGSWFDAGLMVSPLEDGCEKRFRFTADGRIHALNRGDRAAAEMIKRLGLCIPVTIAGRREAIGAIVDSLDELDSKDLSALASQIVSRDNNNEFHEYCVAIANVIDGLIA